MVYSHQLEYQRPPKKQKSPPTQAQQGFPLLLSDPVGIRTQDPNIKSVVLYQLSYEILPYYFGSAKIGENNFVPNFYNIIFHNPLISYQ
jgi:hypothetical protein